MNLRNRGEAVDRDPKHGVGDVADGFGHALLDKFNLPSFRRKPESIFASTHPRRSAYKSRQSGLVSSMISSFQARFHSLIAFSRAIADSWCRAAHTIPGCAHDTFL